VNATARMRSYGARAAAAAVILSMAAGLSACGGKGEKAAVPRPVVRDVEVIVVRSVPRETMAEALGTVRARTTAAVAPQVMGRLTGVAVSEGSVVTAGALLATIDDTTVRAQLSSAEGAVAEAEAAGEEIDAAISQAEAGKALAEKTFERFRKLLEGKVVTQQEFDEVEMRRTVAVKELERARQKRAQVSAKTTQARGQADAAKAMLAWTRVTAPFAGVIVEKRVFPSSSLRIRAATASRCSFRKRISRFSGWGRRSRWPWMPIPGSRFRPSSRKSIRRSTRRAAPSR